MAAHKNEGPEKKDVKPVRGNRPMRDVAKHTPADPDVNWESIFRLLGTPAFILAPDHTILSANNITCLLTGKSETELKGRKCWEIFHAKEATHPPQNCPMEQLLSSKKHEIGEIEVSLNGRVYLVSCTPVFEDKGTISAIIHIATDITQTKQAEEMVHETENRFRLLFERSPVPYQSLDDSGHFLEVNDAWLAALDYTRDEVVGQWFGDFIDPDFSSIFRTNFLKFKAAGETHVEFNMKKKDGTLLLVAFDGKIGHYPDGSFRQTHCVFRDISMDRAAAEALRESEEKYRTLVSSVDAGIILQSASGKILTWNSAAERVFGVSAENVLEHVSTDLKWSSVREDGSPFPASEHPSMITLSTGKPLRDVIMGVTSSTGAFSWISINTTPLVKHGESKPYAVVISFSDITGRKAAEDALKESEKILADIIEKNPMSIQIVDTEGFTLKVNHAHTLLFGSIPPPDFSIFADLQKKQPALEKLILLAKSGEVVNFPEIYFNVHDTYPECPDVPVWVRAIIFSLKDKFGKPERFVLMHENITGRKQANEALKKSEELFRKIFDNSPLGMALVTPDFRFFSVNPTWVSMTGYSEQELLKMSFRDITHPDYIAGDMEHIRELVAGKIPVYQTEKRYIRKDGSILWGFIRVTAIRDEHGTMRHFVAQIEEITERKQAVDALKELSAYNRSLIEASIDPLVTISKNGKIQDVNTATEKATGLTRADLIGTDFSEYFTDPDKAREGYNRVFSEGKVLDYPLEFNNRNGSVTPVLYNATVYNDSNGDVRGVFAAARDITERKLAEEQQECLISELARKNAELDRFTYTVSHDLKSPLLSIQGFLSLLEKDMKSGNADRAQSDIRRITESAEKLERLITTLLALSRSGKSVDTPVQIPFVDIVRDAVRLLDTTLQQRCVTRVIPDSLPIISGDRQRLVQVMTNLLDNAVKFMGDQKEPRIEIGVQDDAGNPVFFVKDNGMGIKRENLSKIFGLYERFNPEIPGTGIGLATVKRIIEAHGGKIWAESEGEGKGTTFRFTLPVVGGHTDNNNNG